MKKTVIIFAGLFAASIVIANGQFEQAMKKNIPKVYSSETPETLRVVINELSRIGEVEKSKWEPHYYIAFGYLRMSEMHDKASDKDKYLDLAMKAVERGEDIVADNSELEAMRGYVHMLKITIDPATRGMTYSGLAFSSFQKAIKLNPENPRAHYLLGRMQHGTAQFMGKDSQEACASLSRAKALFNQKDANPTTIAPGWGESSTNEAIDQICQN